MQEKRLSSGRSTRNRSRQRAAGALLAVSLALVPACGSGDDGTPTPEATATDSGLLGPDNPAQGASVKIGVVSDGTSAMIDNSIQFDVAEATAAYLNEHRAGVGGRPIELVTCETQADPARAADCGNQMIEEGVVAVVVGETAVAESVWQPLADANLPVMFYGAGGTGLLADAESTFTLGDPTFALIQLPIGLAKDLGVEKVTTVVIDVPAALDVVEVAAPALYEKAGIDYEVVAVPPGTADMTPQMQQVIERDPGVVFVVGNDSFCISAFNGLEAVGYDGTISAISQCLSDATRSAVPGDLLDGMVVAAVAPTGGDDESTVLYNTAMQTYDDSIDITSPIGRGMFIVLAGLQAALEGISGDITPETAIAAIKAMPEKPLPGAAGQVFRCNGKAYPEQPAVCVRGGLSTTLDEQGQPTEFEVIGSSPIED